MDALRESLDWLFEEPEFPSDASGCLALLARQIASCEPSLLWLATAEGRVQAAWSADADPSPVLVRELAVNLAEQLAVSDRCLLATTVDGRPGHAFGLRLSEAAERAILGGLVAPSEPWEVLLPTFLVAGELAWRAVSLQGQIDQMRTQIRHLQAEHETLTAAHTEAMISAIEEQERRLQEEQERLAMEQAYAATEAANRAKSQFLAHMSHEIRTPLNAILGFTELLRKGAGRDDEIERQEHLDTISNSGLHLLELINDILDLSKIEAGQMRIESIPCSPQELVADVMDALRVRAEQKGLLFACQWSSPVPAAIRTDSLRVKQLLINLLGNAVKFTAQGKVRLTVTLVAESQPPTLRFEVSDTGIGIPADQWESIFEAFVQVDSSITREFGGTGLGLAISRRIARALGGDITLRSRPGQGSVFTATIETGPLEGIPLVTPSAGTPAPRSAARPSAEPQLPPSRILVVEDGVTNRKLIRLMLQRAGAEVALADNGEAGLARALAEPFDVILMDMQMPVMDGYTATRRLRARGIRTPIIALTAHAMTGDEERCLAAGCSGYLSKPIDAERLLSYVAQCLAQPCPPLPPPAASGGPDEGPDEGPMVSSLPGDDVEFVEVIEEFVRRLEKKLNEMQDALALGDLEALARLAHWLKGSGGTAGFDAFTEPARRLGQSARRNDADGAQAEFAVIRRLAARIVIPVGTKEPSG